VKLTIKFEKLRVERGGDGFVVRVVLEKREYVSHEHVVYAWDWTYVCFKIWVGQRFFDGDTLLGVKRLQQEPRKHPTPYEVHSMRYIPASLSGNPPPEG
jgi:hypothetical protein